MIKHTLADPSNENAGFKKMHCCIDKKKEERKRKKEIEETETIQEADENLQNEKQYKNYFQRDKNILYLYNKNKTILKETFRNYPFK